MPQIAIDEISIGSGHRYLTVVLDLESLAVLFVGEGPRTRLERRARAWTPPQPHYTGGVMAKYAALVSSASEGAVTTGTRMSEQLARG